MTMVPAWDPNAAEGEMHIAELNIGRVRYPLDDPRMAEFMENLDRVNGLADRSPGFVWRMTGADGTNNMENVFEGAPDMNLNLSVWESVEDLRHFVFNTLHDRFFRRKPEWFEILDESAFVMWEIPAGHIPTVEEAFARLEHLKEHGPSPHAWDWDSVPTTAKAIA